MRKYLAELIGTFALVFFGVGSVVLAGKYVGFLGIAFAFGLTLLILVYTIGPISGCHVNPAVTLGMLVVGRIKAMDAVAYIVAQCIGAAIGAGLVLSIAVGIPGGYNAGAMGLGTNGYGTYSPGGYDLLSAFIAETVLTFFFLLVIIGSTSKEAPAGFAGAAIGLTLVAIHIVGIPVDGTSVNPARSLGPALYVGGHAISQLWLFWVAPILGGVIAALTWKFVLHPEAPAAKQAAPA